ncbi:MAG: hypothetical protein ACJAYH_001743 [Celeribacter sp.]
MEGNYHGNYCGTPKEERQIKLYSANSKEKERGGYSKYGRDILYSLGRKKLAQKDGGKS